MSTRWQPISAQATILRAVWMAVTTVLALMTVFPLVWMVSTAFKAPDEVFSMRVLPERPTWANFVHVFTELDFLRYLANSVFVSAVHHRARAAFPFDGGLRAGAAQVSRARDDLPRDVLDIPRLAARHHRAAFRDGALVGSSRQLRRPDRAGDLQRLRHLPPAPVLSLDPPRTGRGRDDRWRGLCADLVEPDPAAFETAPGITRHPLFPCELERLSLAADNHLGSGPLGRPSRDRILQGSVLCGSGTT